MLSILFREGLIYLPILMYFFLQYKYIYIFFIMCTFPQNYKSYNKRKKIVKDLKEEMLFQTEKKSELRIYRCSMLINLKKRGKKKVKIYSNKY